MPEDGPFGLLVCIELNKKFLFSCLQQELLIKKKTG